ncbi:MAG TPA: protealysin inhibitor emfourin [Solirubrobacter sp.]|nr:protealysin inhibitor emfourin [Solirubrobacter sp.]
MNVEIVRGGGIAGVAVCSRLASDALPAPACRTFERLAAAVEPAGGLAAPHPDETTYRVTVDGVTATHTETTLPPPVRALIDFVSARPERREALLPPGLGL